MSRITIVAMSIVCCVFGALAIAGPGHDRAAAYAVNVALALACFVAAGHDLRQRGWELGYLFAGAYLLPLVGLVVYVGLSVRPKLEGTAVVGA